VARNHHLRHRSARGRFVVRLQRRRLRVLSRTAPNEANQHHDRTE
jgi:hypothetical protein